jgi:hypothetical protein
MSPIPYCFSAQIVPPYADDHQPFHDVLHAGDIEERGKSGKNVLHDCPVDRRESEISEDSSGLATTASPYPGLLTATTSVDVSHVDPCRSCSLACWTHPQRECPQSGIHCTSNRRRLVSVIERWPAWMRHESSCLLYRPAWWLPLSLKVRFVDND